MRAQEASSIPTTLCPLAASPTCMAATTSVGKSDDAAACCVHHEVLPSIDHISVLCAKCDKPVDRLLKLYEANVALKERLDETDSLLKQKERGAKQGLVELSRLQRLCTSLEDQCDIKTDEHTRLMHEISLAVEGQAREREEKENIRWEKQRLEAELGDLSAALFEEANDMVASERRRHHDLETSERMLLQRLNKAEALLLFERQQLNELRLKLEESMDVNTAVRSHSQDSIAKTLVDSETRSKRYACILQLSTAGPSFNQDYEFINPKALSDFCDFIDKAESLPLTKLMSLQYLRGIIQTDLGPCLSFHPSARVSNKRLVDAVLFGNAQIERWSRTPNNEIGLLGDSPSRSLQTSSVTLTSTSPVTARKFFSSLTSLSVQQPIFDACNLCMTQEDQPFLLTINSSPTTVASSFPLSRPLSLQMAALQDDAVSSVGSQLRYPICHFCRDRVVSACDFAAFLSHIQRRPCADRSVNDLWNMCVELRIRMLFTRIGGATTNLHSNMDPISTCQESSPNDSAISLSE